MKPTPPKSRIIREGTEGTCTECHSTELKRFVFFGKKIGCINPECENYAGNPNRNKFTNITEGKTKSNTKIVTSKRLAPHPPPVPRPLYEYVYKTPGVYQTEQKFLVDDNVVKQYSYNDMLLFAETCMLTLLSTEPPTNRSIYPEITSENIRRIAEVLKPYRDIEKL